MRQRKAFLFVIFIAEIEIIHIACCQKQALDKMIIVTGKNKKRLLDGLTFPTLELDRLKTLLIKGHVADFKKLTGLAYTLCGEVVEGNRVGRRLGYPTANLETKGVTKLIPGQGAYAVKVKVEDKWHQGMANVGIRPTLDLHHVTIEAHLFDFNKDIYGKEICIAFMERIRDEMKFSSLHELKAQLDKDSETAKEILEEIKWS